MSLLDAYEPCCRREDSDYSIDLPIMADTSHRDDTAETSEQVTS